jgi:hypothetical protein
MREGEWFKQIRVLFGNLKVNIKCMYYTNGCQATFNVIQETNLKETHESKCPQMCKDCYIFCAICKEKVLKSREEIHKQNDCIRPQQGVEPEIIHGLDSSGERLSPRHDYIRQLEIRAPTKYIHVLGWMNKEDDNDFGFVCWLIFD